MLPYSVDMDSDTHAFLRTSVAAEFALPAGWGDRLSGDSITALRADAAKLATVLGIREPEPVERDEAGRFASSSGHDRLNRELRAAAGVVLPAAQLEPDPVHGTLGA